MRSLSELHHEAMSLKLVKTEQHVGCYTKEQLMDLLMVHYNSRSWIVRKRPLLKQLPVMLARNVKDLKEGEFDMMLNSGDWVAEEKLDGVRAKLHLGTGGNRIDSRHRSDITYEYVEKTDSLPHLRDLEHSMPETVLDGELIMPVESVSDGKTDTEGYLTSTTATVNSKPERAIELQERVGYCRFFAFDILFYCGEDVHDAEYQARYGMLRAVQSHLFSVNPHPVHVPLPMRCTLGLEVFYKKLVGVGSEGIMLKRLDWPYESSKRSKGMYKWKKQFDMDCFITGFVPGKGEFSGLVGALLVSTVDAAGNKQEVAAVQPGALHHRRLISEADGALCDGMYGKVVEVSYLCKTKNKRLRHAVLKRFRPDKTMYDCKSE